MRAMKHWSILAILRTTAANWAAHDAPRLGASLAFYTILSMSPLVVLAVAIAALFFDRAIAQDELLNQAQALLGREGRRMVAGILESSQQPASGVFASIISITTLLFGASGVFGELRSALNRLDGVTDSPSLNFYQLIKDRLFSFGMVLAIGFLLMVSLLLSASVAAIAGFSASLLPVPAAALEAANFLLSYFTITGLFALIFRYIPDRTVPWRDVLAGAVTTAFLFTIGKTLIGLYLGKASVGSTYGAAGSLLVITVWVYYSAQIFFFGAEFTRVWARRGNAVSLGGPARVTDL